MHGHGGVRRTPACARSRPAASTAPTSSPRSGRGRSTAAEVGSSSVRRRRRWCPARDGRRSPAAPGVLTGGEAVGQLGELNPRVGGLAFGPLVSVEPDLDWVGEVGADLDERRPEVVVQEIEVEARHSPVGLDETKAGDAVGALAFMRRRTRSGTREPPRWQLAPSGRFWLGHRHSGASPRSCGRPC